MANSRTIGRLAEPPDSTSTSRTHLFMSVIHTCQLRGANSFDFRVELQRHAQELAACPAEWMPWNYRDTLAHAAELLSE